MTRRLFGNLGRQDMEYRVRDTALLIIFGLAYHVICKGKKETNKQHS